MPFQPGQSGNPGGQNHTKPYRAALLMEVANHENGKRLTKVRKGSLRDLARQALMRARSSTNANTFIAEKLDGKIPQPIANDEENPPVQIVEVRLVMVDAVGQELDSPPPLEGEKPREVLALPNPLVKRGRGRPRKQPLPLDVVSDPQDEGSK